MPITLPIAIYYEQPNWFKPLFAELDKRAIPYVKLYAPDHFYAPEDHPEEKYSLVFNRMSPSAWNRGHGDQIFYTLGFLEHLESRGVKVINGFKAFSIRAEQSRPADADGQARHCLPKGPCHPPGRSGRRSSRGSALAYRRQAEHRRLGLRRQAL